MAEWQANLKDLDPQVRRKAVEALGRFGPSAIPALIQALQDTDADVCLTAILALERIEPAAIPTLSEVLQDTSRPERWVAAAVLGKMGPPANDAVPALVLALRDTDSTMRRAVVEALEKIGPAPQAAIPALVRALWDPNPLVRQQAAEALGKLGPAAKAAVPLLKRATRDRSSVVRSLAKLALKRISPEWVAERRIIIFGSIAALGLLWALVNLPLSQQSRFRFSAGDRLINVNNGVEIGVVVRTEENHTFRNGTVGRAYIIRMPNGVEIDLVADRVEKIARKGSASDDRPTAGKGLPDECLRLALTPGPQGPFTEWRLRENAKDAGSLPEQNIAEEHGAAGLRSAVSGLQGVRDIYADRRRGIVISLEGSVNRSEARSDGSLHEIDSSKQWRRRCPNRSAGARLSSSYVREPPYENGDPSLEGNRSGGLEESYQNTRRVTTQRQVLQFLQIEGRRRPLTDRK